jgi:hypothetical protein
MMLRIQDPTIEGLGVRLSRLLLVCGATGSPPIGAEGSPPIGAKDTLVFVVEILSAT